VLIGITKQGNWIFGQKMVALQGGKGSTVTSLVPQEKEISGLDVVFPVLHGPFGEDGTMQGLLKIAGIPFVGADVLGSAVGMDKDVMKRLLRDAGIPIGKFVVLRKNETPSYKNILKTLGSPLFIKPANLGSSVGVHKVKNEREFEAALKDAFNFDTKIIVEEYIECREIECSVLGNDDPIASVPGEVIVKHEFYSYDAKYIDENGAALEIPAKLTKPQTNKIQELAIKTFKVLECSGMARVDFFMTKKGKILVNEINTIPGFTSISMYPKLWEASGISYSELVSRLITLALEKHRSRVKLKTSYI
jgi:D-alanine-D-alanine ligase